MPALQKKSQLLRVYKTWSLSKRMKYERNIRGYYGPVFLKKLQRTLGTPGKAGGSSRTGGEATHSVKAAPDGSPVPRAQEAPTPKEDVISTISDTEVIAPATDLPDEIFSPSEKDQAPLITDKTVYEEDVCQQDEAVGQSGGAISPLPVTGSNGNIASVDSQHAVGAGGNPLQSMEVTHIGSTPRMKQPPIVHRRKGTPRQLRRRANNGSMCTRTDVSCKDPQNNGSTSVQEGHEDAQQRGKTTDQEVSGVSLEASDIHGGQEGGDVGNDSNDVSLKESHQGVKDSKEDEDNVLEETEGSMLTFSPLAESTRASFHINLSREEGGGLDAPWDESALPQKSVTIPRRKTAHKQFPSLAKQQSKSTANRTLTAPGKFTPHPRGKRRMHSQGRHGRGRFQEMEMPMEEALLKEKVMNKSSPTLKVVCTDLRSSPEGFKRSSDGQKDLGGVSGSLAMSAQEMADSMKEKMKKKLLFASPGRESPERCRWSGDNADPKSSTPLLSAGASGLLVDGGHRDEQQVAPHEAWETCDHHMVGREGEVPKDSEIAKEAATATGSPWKGGRLAQGTNSGAAEMSSATHTSGGVDSKVAQPKDIFADVLVEVQSSVRLLKEQRRVSQSLAMDSACGVTMRQQTSNNRDKAAKRADDGDLTETASGHPKETASHSQNADWFKWKACENPDGNSADGLAVGGIEQDSDDRNGRGSQQLAIDVSQDAANREDQMEGSINATMYAPVGVVQGGDGVKMALIIGEQKESGGQPTPPALPGATCTLEDAAAGGETLNDPEPYQFTQKQRKERRQTIWEGSLRKTPAKFKPFQVPEASKKKRKAAQEQDAASPIPPAAIPDQCRTPKEYRKVAVPTGATPKAQGRPSTSQDQSPNTVMVKFSLGQLIWGHMRGYPWWPGKVVHHFAMKRQDPPPPGHVVIQWYGDMKYSVMKQDQISTFETFKEHLNLTFLKKRGLYRKAMFQALRVAATQAGLTIGETTANYPKRDSTEEEKTLFQESLDEMVGWAERGFLPAKGLVPLAEDTQIPPPPSPDRSEPKEKKAKKGTGATWADTREVFVEGCKKQHRAEKFHLLKKGDIMLEDFCIACGSTSDLTEAHPLFVGQLCGVCRIEYLETAFMFGNDGYQCYCCICAEGKELMLCENSGCYRSFCTTCIGLMISPEAATNAMSEDHWVCYMCRLGDTFGYLTVREDWPHRHRDFFSRDRDVDYAPLSTWPPKPLHERKPIRVLSLFDGIGTGMYVLRDLGFKVDAYVASEVDADAIKVSSVRHNGMITQVGDVCNITSKELAEWGPIDLLIGGSPCNDLSVVNPARKGIYGGSGLLFFEYHRILKLLQKNSDTERPLFWFFENVVFMDHQTKMTINRFFECNPVLVDAKDLSAAHRARYFWGNLPGMNRPSAALLDSPLQLQDCLEQHCNRKAKFSKIRTITTKGNSLRQKKESQLPVEMDGKEDTLWCTELERLFGLPDHYTDVSNLNRNDRQRLLGKCWSVPVINHLLSPLKDYFQCE